MRYTDKVTIDAVLDTLEKFGAKDQPVIIEVVHHGEGYRHYFDSFRNVRTSKEYTGAFDTDPVIWYEATVDMIWRDPDEDIAVITLDDDEEE